MFTGITEGVGEIRKIRFHRTGAVLTIEAKKILEEEDKIGDSICVNGVCLTVVEIGTEYFCADVMPETMRRSNLGSLKNGSRVNLERAMKANGRFGGHLVSGHIDGTGTVFKIEKEDNAVWLGVQCEKSLLRYVVQQGAIAIDGVSLTVASLDAEGFQVSLIPHTAASTTLLTYQIGTMVNLETDVIGKYVERFFSFRRAEREKKSFSLDFLKENGF